MTPSCHFSRRRYSKFCSLPQATATSSLSLASVNMGGVCVCVYQIHKGGWINSSPIITPFPSLPLTVDEVQDEDVRLHPSSSSKQRAIETMQDSVFLKIDIECFGCGF